jgi:hypothetical protein
MKQWNAIYAYYSSSSSCAAADLIHLHHQFRFSFFQSGSSSSSISFFYFHYFPQILGFAISCSIAFQFIEPFFWRGYCLVAFQVGCRSDFCHGYGGMIAGFSFWEDEQHLLWMSLKPLNNYFGFIYKTIKNIKSYLWFQL